MANVSSGASGEGQETRGLALRAAHWSASHRKTAIFGCLGFWLIAVATGQAAGQKTIFGADNFTGEAGRAEHALEDAGLRPNDEVALVQSKRLTIAAPEFRGAIEQTAARLRRAQYVVNVKSPLGEGAPVSD